MKTLQNFISMVETLRATSSRVEKEEIMVSAFKNDADVVKILNMVYNPFRNYYIIPRNFEDFIDDNAFKYESSDTEVEILDFILGELELGHGSDEAWFWVSRIFSNPPTERRDVLFIILQRTIDAGVGIKTINKAIKKAGVGEQIQVFEVMLAHPFTEKDFMRFPNKIAEEKIDGVRVEAICDEVEVKLLTRNGSQVDVPSRNVLKPIFAAIDKKFKLGVISLEIVANNRQSTSGHVTRIMKADADELFEPEGLLKEACDSLEYYVFDYLPYNDFMNKSCTIPLRKRREMLETAIKELQGEGRLSPKVHLVRSWEANTVEQVNEAFDEVVKAGGEGVVVKNLDGFYEFKRSYNWLKLKEFLECDLKIVGFTEGYGKRSGKIGSLLLESGDGKIRVGVGTGLTDSDIDYITEHQQELIGTICTVKYNGIIESKTESKKSLFIPVFVSLRPDKTEADKL